MKEKAVVLFSGGIDSTTALHWARKRYRQVVALTFDYSQKHRLEVQMARRVALRLGCPFHLIRLPLKGIVESALIDDRLAIPDSLNANRDAAGIPITYVPFRNGIFLAIAAAFAESRGIWDLVTGFNFIDTPEYPDTTRLFTRRMQAAVNAGTSAAITGAKFHIHVPLLNLGKKEIIAVGLRLGADYSHSLSCYRGGEVPCQRCPSCEIRMRAFRELRIEDPLIVRLSKEKKP